MKGTRYMTRSFLVLAVFTATAIADDAGTSFDFTLRSHEGREWSSSDFADKQLMVVAFLGTECPLVKLYGPRLQRLSEEYADDVAVVGINANTQDSVTEMSAYAERYGVKFPLLKDVGNRVADQFNAQRTPEVFLLDADRRIRYRGRIDNQYGVGIVRDKADREDLRQAIEELLAEQTVSVPQTEVVGCHIGRVKKVAPTGEITYTKHISRLFNKRCVECHRDGELAPFPLTRYEDVIGWEDTICEVIEDNRMPPWFANPAHGKFRNDCRLSAAEKQTVHQWVENGMPEGDPADLPEPPEFQVGWRIPKPDQVFFMRDAPFRVKAQGTIDYQYFVVDPKWDEDKYITAAEARPDNKSVVHHILVYIIGPGEDSRAGLEKILVGYAPGSMPVLLDEGVALKVEAGSKLLFQMHYTPNGYVQEDRSYAGVKFMDEQDVTRLIRGEVAINGDFRIPPNTDKHVVTADHVVKRDKLLVAMTPHMHLRGKSFRYELVHPDGESEVLLDVPRYDFNWQLKYILETPKLLPRGSTIRCTAVYDNSEANLSNPNPNEWVGEGEQSWEEMMIGFFDTLPPVEREVRKSSTSLDPTGVYAWQGTRPGKLNLEMHAGVLLGTLESHGKEYEIEEAVIEGNDLSFVVDTGRMFLEFSAKIDDETIHGNIKWTIPAAGRDGDLGWIAHKK